MGVKDRTSPPDAARAATSHTLVAAVFGAVVTALVAGLPSLRLAYRSQEGHLVLETAIAMTGSLVALLVYGRFRRSGSLQELLLAHALSVLALAALFLTAIPIVAGVSPSSAITTWAPLVVRIVGALLLLAAALTPGDRRVSKRRAGQETVVVALLLACVAGAVHLLSAALPTAVTALPPPEQSTYPRLEGHPVVLGAQVVAVLCYATAALAFARQARRTGDELIGWFAAACALGAWARVNYLLFPSIYSEWLYTGDFLRFGFYLLLFVGGVREVRAYWRAQADLAVYAERRRLARDLHDGLLQELGYIRHLLAATDHTDSERPRRLLGSIDRAMDEARRAVAAFVTPLDEPVATAVARAVREVADRYDIRVHLDDQEPVEIAGHPLELREALVRIAREAVANAARHAEPSAVWVTLHRRGLCIEDDGRGFAPEDVRPGRFGLVSMQDRAEGVGARLRLESAPGTGTRLEVTW